MPRPGDGDVDRAVTARYAPGDSPADAVFAALSDRTRRAVLQAVADEGPVTSTELASRFPVTRQAVAKHLAVLRSAGLVAADRVGRETLFTAVPEPLIDASRWLVATGDAWDARLRRLRARATAPSRDER